MLTCASLFSGAGGWEVGARAAGLTPLYAVEYDAKIAAVHKDNFPESVVIADSLLNVSDEQIAYLPTPDVLFASPPCQAHSINRSKKLAPRDDSGVGIDVLRWVRIQRPAHVLIENVPGYAKAEVFANLVEGLQQLGYAVAHTVVDAAAFGVPQHRKRLICHASRVGLPTLPQPYGQRLTWFAAIFDLLPTLPTARLYPKHAEQVATSDTPRLVDGANAGRPVSIYGPDRVSFTISASIWKAPPFFVQGDSVLRLTPRAVARLCSFPDSYRLPDDKKTAYKVLGNAVPPMLASCVVTAALSAV